VSDVPDIAPELSDSDAERLGQCLAGEGICLFPADTVYGLGCDPASRTALSRLYELKGRPPQRPAAVMFFSLQAALAALADIAPRERTAILALLPGPLTLLLNNPRRRFPLACGPDPLTLGIRVPSLPGPLAALQNVRAPVVQTSANLSGQPDARRLSEVPGTLLQRVDLVLDGGELPGTPSTVLDLRDYERAGEWRVLREGPVGDGELRRALG
jgi:L-threonylcarbamoyladenylate synthase